MTDGRHSTRPSPPRNLPQQKIHRKPEIIIREIYQSIICEESEKCTSCPTRSLLIHFWYDSSWRSACFRSQPALYPSNYRNSNASGPKFEMAPESSNAANYRSVEILAAKLRRRQVIGSRTAALETVLVLRQVVSKARFSNIDQLVGLIRDVGRRLAEVQPKGVHYHFMYVLVEQDLMSIIVRAYCRKHRTESVAQYSRGIQFGDQSRLTSSLKKRLLNIKVCPARSTPKTERRDQVRGNNHPEGGRS